MKKRLRIGITGPIAERNLGDYAMFINNVLYLGKDHEYVVFSYDHEFVRTLRKHYLDGFAVEDHEVHLQVGPAPHASKWRRGLGRCRNCLRRALRVPDAAQSTFETPLELLRTVANYDELRQATDAVDVLVVSGGGYLNRLWYSPWGRQRLFCMLIPVLLADAGGKRIVFTGNSYGPFDDTAGFFQANLATLHQAVFAHRDDLLSPVNLRAIGVEAGRLRSVPDDLCILRPEITHSPISIPDDPYIGLELYYPTSYLGMHLAEIKTFVEQMQTRYGVKTLFLPFASGDGGEAQGRFLERQIDSSCFQCWPLEQGFLPVEHAHPLIGRARLLVTNRYHGVVLAVSARTPVVNVLKPVNDHRYYYTKTRGFLNKVFDGLYPDDRSVIRTSLPDALPFVQENFRQIQEEQRRWMASARFEENRKTLDERRRNLFHQDILGEN